ncbi:MAG: UDP-N-acetylmuramate dehydrogenase [Acidimicrobiales bacterium]
MTLGRPTRRGGSVEPVEAAADVLGPKARRGFPIGQLTTYRVGGAADLYFEANSLEDLERVGEALRVSELAVLVIGKGSNLLVTDGGFEGLVLTLGEGFAAIETAGTRLSAGGSASLPVVARASARTGLTGFEWAVGVPGSIGGAVRMNAGGHGSDMSQVTDSASVWDLFDSEVEDLDTPGLDFGYRRSSISSGQVVIGAVLALSPGDRPESESEISKIVSWRRANQPGGRNAGSVFTNPPDDSAGRLIELAGLKGHRIGTAGVSTKHANFIQADSGGSADDVVALVVFVMNEVEKRVGYRLTPELKIVGRSAPAFGGNR